MFGILLVLTVLQLRLSGNGRWRPPVAPVELLFKRSVFRAVLVYTALLAIAWCWLFPIAWAVSGSLKAAARSANRYCFPRTHGGLTTPRYSR